MPPGKRQASADDGDRLSAAAARPAVRAVPARVPVSSARRWRASATGVGWSNTRVAGSRRPVAAESRLRSSTAASESKPSSRKARVRADVLGGAVAEDGGDVALHEVGEERFALRLQQPGEPVLEGVGAAGRRLPGGRAGPAYGHQGAEQRGQAVALGAQRGHVQFDGQDGGARCRAQRRRRGRRLLRLQRGDPAAGDAGEVGLVQGAGHAAGLRPQTPGQGVRGQSEGAAVHGERVEVGVGGGVVGLGPASRGWRRTRRTARTPTGRGPR